MNAIAKTSNGTAVAAADDFDPFAAYGDSMGGSRIVGTMLKFSKGDYLVGQNGDVLPEGTKLAVNMNELVVGWIKWKDKKPIEQLMGRLVDRFTPPKRDELDSRDETEWEVDKDNKPQDPWQFTNYLIMKVPGADDQDSLFTFVTSSNGGLKAVGMLSKAYSVQKRLWADEMPLVSLGIHKYKHDEYGWIKNPQFKIVGKVAADEFALAMEEEATQAAADAERRADTEIPF